jgi:NAD(P)-dependent dehydrogenase (short-subunit alcohol dehydrogenase family)
VGSSKPVAVVTGGSRGIGAATCRLLGARGFVVVVNYARDLAAAEHVVSGIVAAGGEAVAVKADVAGEAEVCELFMAADRLGALKVLVNNAGVVDLNSRLDAMSVARLNRMFGINIIGSFVAAREAVRRMSTRHGGTGGAIVNVSSVAALLGAPSLYVDYAASKGAIDTFTLGLAREVAEEGIRVNAVRPGIIDTDIHASGGAPERVAAMRSVIPMKREGTADEVAAAIAWLVSDEASYVTGAIINVGGGRS